MTERIHSHDTNLAAVNSVLSENGFRFVVDNIMAQAVLFAALKISIRKLLKKAKLDKDLSREITALVNKSYAVRIINDERVFSFDDMSGTIWISSGLTKLVDEEELISVLLHEVGHGDDKLKLMYQHLTMNPINPQQMRRICIIVGHIVKSKGVRVTSIMKTQVYLLAYITYISFVGNPFHGLYKWSYSDLAVQLGYWDQYESALGKINRYITKQRPSKIALAIANVEEKNPGTAEELKNGLYDSYGDNSENVTQQARKISSNRIKAISSSIISKILRFALG